MSGLRALFGGNQPTSTPTYTGLQIQTAVNTLPVPIVYGESKIAPNVIWYNGFQTDLASGGKGGVFSSNNTNQPTYTASVILALCEGPIAGINQVWKDQSIYSLAELGFTIFGGSTPQTVWSYISTAYPTQALAYQGTAYVCAPNYNLSASATLDNHNFEVQGVFYATGVNGIDADCAQIVNDFLTNAQYGVGFPSGSIDTTTLFGSGGDASYQTYCKAVGIALSPALVNQETASSILQRWLQITNTAAVWSGGQLKFIPYGDIATTAGTHVSTTTMHEIGETPVGASNPAPVVVAGSAYFVSDNGVTYAATGAALSYIGAAYPTNAGTYGMSPGGTYLFAEGDEGTDVEISYTYEIAASYTPDLTPIYDLADDDFLVGDGEVAEDPLQVARSDPYEAYNVWRLEVAERDNAYNLTTVEARDQNAIELYGMRIASTVTAHEICDPDIALISAQLLLQRALYVRNTYTFKLSWEYCLLDPMDLVTVTDEALGLDQAAVRITAIEEDENGFLAVTAEEFPNGIATATLYATHIPAGFTANRNVIAGPVNSPLIFEPPYALGGGFELWAAVSSEDPLWGGANVWISFDSGTSYQQIGVAGKARMGLTTAILPNYTGSNPDTTDTLAVDLSMSNGALSASSDAAALALANIVYLDGEVVGYGAATLTAANKYNVTYLVRGAYGSTIASHASGVGVTLLDNNVFQYTFDASRIGASVLLKFQSFNVWGGGAQSLADCVAYPYTLTGSSIGAPLISTVADFAAEGVTLNGPNGTSYPGIACSWTAVTDKTVASVLVSFQIHGDAASVQTQAFPPGGGSGVVLSSGLLPATEYDVWATIAVNPLREVTNTSTIEVTTPASQTVLSSITVGPGGVSITSFEAGLQNFVTAVFASIQQQADDTAGLIASVAQEQDAQNWLDKYNVNANAFTNNTNIQGQINTLTTSTTAQFATANAAIDTNATAIADLNGAFASYQVAIVADFASTNANVTTNATAIADLNGAFASYQVAIVADFASTNANVTTNATAISDLSGSFADFQLTVSAEFDAANSSITQNATAISSLTDSFSSFTTTVDASLGSLNSSVTENATAVADINNALATQWTLTLNVDGYVSGIQAYNNGQDSELILIASAFEVAEPGAGGAPPIPVFAIANVNGSPKVVLAADMISDASITADAMAANSITGNNVQAGTLTAGNIVDNGLTQTQFLSVSSVNIATTNTPTTLLGGSGNVGGSGTITAQFDGKFSFDCWFNILQGGYSLLTVGVTLTFDLLIDGNVAKQTFAVVGPQCSSSGSVVAGLIAGNYVIKHAAILSAGNHTVELRYVSASGGPLTVTITQPCMTVQQYFR